MSPLNIPALAAVGVLSFFATSQSLAAFIGIGVALITGWVYLRQNVGKIYRETAEGWKGRAEQLETDLGLATSRIHDLERQVAALQAKTDISLLQEQATRHHAQTIELLASLGAVLRDHR